MENITVVLVRTLYPSNIGATSRAMVNMGISRLVLVDPQCEVNSQAQKSAAGAQSPLENRTTYGSWQEFFQHEGDGIRIGLTRRGGAHRVVTDLGETLGLMLTESAAHRKDQESEIAPATLSPFGQPLYLVFGPENNGLQASDLQWLHHSCVIPTYNEMGSLNLAQAVLLALFILRQVLGTIPFGLRKESNLHHDANESTAMVHSVAQSASDKSDFSSALPFPEETAREWLKLLGFDLSAPKSNAFLSVMKILGTSHAQAHDLDIFETILQQNIRRLRSLASDNLLKN